jgi:hypothetical protein
MPGWLKWKRSSSTKNRKPAKRIRRAFPNTTHVTGDSASLHSLRARGLPLSAEAFPAEDRSPLGWPEGDRCLFSTLGTNCFGLNFRTWLKALADWRQSEYRNAF